MFGKHKSLILTLLAGLALGALSGTRSTSSSRGAEVIIHAAPAFDEKEFTKAESTNSCLILARQLPHADAEKCAALAKIMLTKRIRTLVGADPFAPASEEEFVEDYLPENAWEGLFKRWMKVAPQAAWDFVKTHHSEELPLRAAALCQWALLDPTAAVLAAGTEISKYEMKCILTACANSNPEIGLQLAIDWQLNFLATSDDPFNLVPSLITTLLTEFAQKSPAAALEWAKAHAPNQISAVCLGWIRNDANACLKWVQTLPVDEQKTIMEEVCGQHDVSATSIRHFASLGAPEELRDTLYPGLRNIAYNNEALSQTLIEELITNPTDRMQLRADIGYRIMRADPRKAMNFLLPSLRTALPLFEIPEEQFETCGMGGGIYPVTKSSPHSSMDSIFDHYLALGPTAGVGKDEVLAVFKEIHAQYLPWILQENSFKLTELLGNPAQWAEPFATGSTKEIITSLISQSNYPTAAAAWQDAKALSPGPLRDALLERYIELQIEENTPVSVIFEQIQRIGENKADLYQVYATWMDREPMAAMNHLAQNPQASPDEWNSVITEGYESHGERIQTMAAALPKGELRDSVSAKLADIAMEKHSDYVTSIYWATEIASKKDRANQIRLVIEKWQTDREAWQNETLIENLRTNIEHSPLTTAEKALWLERIESEVLR